MVAIPGLVPAGSSVWWLVVSIAVAQLSGLLSSAFVVGQIKPWYDLLKAPSFKPPHWLFGVVWTILYTCLGFASYIVWAWCTDTYLLVVCYVLYACQLVAGMAWTWVFFSRHDLQGAIPVIVLYLTLTAAVCGFFWAVSPIAGGLVVPVIAWVAFAYRLNVAYAALNPVLSTSKQ